MGVPTRQRDRSRSWAPASREIGASRSIQKGRLTAILKRRSALGPDAYVFGTGNGSYQPNIQTAWERPRLLACGVEPKPGRKGAEWNREQLHKIDLWWHDLRHEGACRVLADGVDSKAVLSCAIC